jgi:non-ribosomal peptide synthase protein (TIGR01720 family)
VKVEQGSDLSGTNLYGVYGVRPGEVAEDEEVEEEVKREWTSKEELVRGVREYLNERIPDYMVPTHFVVMEAMPLTANGKVDRKGLPALDGSDKQTVLYVAPGNEIEQALCEVWQEVLKVDRVGVGDNFFSLGGDSILSIQVVSRAKRAGIAITIRQLFAYQTVAQLASQVDQTPIRERSQDMIEGELPLLPIQREFLAANQPSYAHNNQSVLLAVPPGFRPQMLHAIVEALYRCHDALRLRFTYVDGRWQALHLPLTASMVSESCVFETLPDDPSLQSHFISERCQHYQRSLDIGQGPLLRAVYFQGHDQGRLFLVIHHLVVDGVSWRILLGDLEEAYGQLCEGKPIQMALKTSSYQQWAHALAEYSTSPALQRERAYWHDTWTNAAASWPVTPLSTTPALHASTRSVLVELSEEETAALLTECPRAYHTGINELLLSALYWGMRWWSGQTRLRIALEGHGREDLFEALDTTRTVGCFTTKYPLVLGSEDGEIGAVIKAVKEQYRAVPHHGIGYGLLQYMAGDEALMAAEAVNPPALLFNYLGRFDQTMTADSAFAMATESTGESVDPQGIRTHALNLNGLVGGGRLRFLLDYSEAQYAEETVAELARQIEQGLRMVIAHCLEVGEGDYTPSDFPLSTVDQGVLDQWQRAYEIENLYPSTAMQKGMLFHSLLEQEAYVTQLYPTLEGDLRLPLLRQAWETIIERYAIFRTIFIGEGELQHQLVLKHASLPWHEEDWRMLSEDEQKTRFEEYRQADKARGFDVTQPPLMRISAFRLGDRRYQLLWSHHHSLLDGWSVPLVYRDAMVVYEALAQGRAAGKATAPEYARYIEWLLGQDKEEAREYWRSYLAEVDVVTPLPMSKRAGDGRPRHDSQVVSLSAGDTAELKGLAKRYQTTINTLVQLAWGILLQRYSGEKEVMFGAVISGRSAEVEGIESMVGLFINTIPVVVRFGEERRLEGLTAELHRTFQESQSYGYLPLTEIQKQSRSSKGRALFESLLVFENYPLDSAMGEETSAALVRIEKVGMDVQDTYPIALGVFQGEGLEVT